MDKIRIINDVLHRAFKEPDHRAMPPINDSLNQSLHSNIIPVKRHNWLCILSAMQEIETIFAIPPIILTQYINNNSLHPEHIYSLVNPLATIINYYQLNQYLTELETLIHSDIPDRRMDDHITRIELCNKINKYYYNNIL